jgi:hypothetical protein
MDPAQPSQLDLPLIDFVSLYDKISNFLTDIFPGFISLTKDTVGFIVGISIPISVFFLIGIIYCVERLKVIRAKEEEKYDLKVEQAYEAQSTDSNILSERWNNILKHVESTNPNDWRQAIMDADIILDDLLTKMEYRGESVGEKLKRVVKGDFETLDEAWEAHKVRNLVAHEGSAASLDQHEARRVIGLYRKVFEEFYYI